MRIFLRWAGDMLRRFFSTLDWVLCLALGALMVIGLATLKSAGGDSLVMAQAVAGSTCKRTAHRVASRCLLRGPSLGAARSRGRLRPVLLRMRAQAPGVGVAAVWPVARA